MFVIPITHDSTSVRRHPWVTYTIMAICLGVFMLTNNVGDQAREAAEVEFQEAITYYLQHPYLALDVRVSDLVGNEFVELARADYEATVAVWGEKKIPEFRRVEQQIQLDELIDKAFVELDKDPVRSWGLVTGDLSPITFVTHMFLHGGWMHLIGNMLLLFLTGSFIEDRWGRPLYSSFYLVSGLAAAAVFSLRYPALQIPMVGASGAIAGMMGAFLVRYFRTKIRFAYLFWFVLVFYGTFTAPAWLMLPLWFGWELLSAQIMDTVAPGAGGGGVAHWAHVGGFAFGALGALGLKYFRIEERFIDEKLDAKVQVAENNVLEEALLARENEDHEAAFEMLEAEQRRQPRNRDVALAFWDVASALERASEAAAAMVRVVHDEFRSGEEELALGHFVELAGRVPDFRAESGLLLRIAPRLAETGRADIARIALHRALEGEVPVMSAIAVRVAKAARELDPQLAFDAAKLAFDSGELGPSDRIQIEAIAVEMERELDKRRGPATATEQAAERVAAQEDLGVEGLEDGGLVSAADWFGNTPAAASEEPTAFDPSEIDLDAPLEMPEEAPESDFGLDQTMMLDPDALSEPGEEHGGDEDLLRPEVGSEPSFGLDQTVMLDPDEVASLGSLEEGPCENGVFDPEQLGEEVTLVEEKPDDDFSLDGLLGARALLIEEGVPRVLEAQALRFDATAGHTEVVTLADIDAVAVAAVKGIKGKPVLIVDLMTNWLDLEAECLHVIRFRSDRFDPRQLVGEGGSPLDALRQLVGRILDGSGATPLPDADAAAGRPFRTYDTLVEYEGEVLGAAS